MSDIKVDVILPSAVSVDVTSPTQALAANILVPGPQGPRGADGQAPEPIYINNLSGSIFITGADGVQVLATGNNVLVVSGNSGYFQELVDQLFNTGRFLSGSLEVLGSGLFRLGVKVGTDSVLITPSSIFIEGDPVVTETKLNQLSGYFENENTIGFNYSLSAGDDSYFVTYPNVLNSSPRSVNCVFQNPVDNLIYYFSIGNVNKTGFYINFSDILDNNGYYLNINVKK